MQRLAAGIIITCGLIILFAFAFTLYAQFALDYSLENLKESLATTQKESPTDLDNRVSRLSLENMALEELTRKDADLSNVVMLEHAAHSIRDAVEQSGYAKAGFYLTEVLKKKSADRSPMLNITDAIFHFFKSIVTSFQHFWDYLRKRFQRSEETSQLAGTGILILGEAERMEESGKLNEAERYYQEFLNRYPGRPEQGFVRTSLANVLMKMRRFDEAQKLLDLVKEEFPGRKEETLAKSLLDQITEIHKEEARLPELENTLKTQPDSMYEREVGFELALNYIGAYQAEKAVSILEKLQEAPDPRIRTKALFYLGLLHKWAGDLDKGKEVFEKLNNQPQLGKNLEVVSQAELADIHFQKKEYKEARNSYEELSRKAASESWRALSQMEQSKTYLLGVGDAKEAQRHLQDLEQFVPRNSTEYEVIRRKLEETLQTNLRDEGFALLTQGRVELASDKFQEHLKKYPRDGWGHSAVASIDVLHGRLKEATDEAEMGFGYVRDGYTATVLAYTYEGLGRLEEAIRYYEVAVEISPSYYTALYNLARVYAITGRYNDSEKLLAKLDKEYAEPATRAKILNNWGCALWGLGKREEAIARFKEALKLTPDFTEARSNLKLSTGEKPVLTIVEPPVLR